MAKTLFQKVFGKAEKPEDRTPEQKNVDLHAGTREADQALVDKALSRRQKDRKLAEIKKRYRMTSLEFVTDSEAKDKETLHVRGVINPTYDEKGHVLDKWPPDSVIINAELKKPHKRKGFEEVLARGVTVGLPQHQRAHAMGAGFGVESVPGIYYATKEVNQVLQNRGIERFIRDTWKQKRPDAQLHLTTVVTPVKGTEILESITYILKGKLASDPEPRTIFVIHIQVVDALGAKPSAQVSADPEYAPAYTTFLEGALK
jgi:hypothetical protein